MNAQETCRSYYTDINAAQARIDAQPNVKALVAMCNLAVATCNHPGFKFGLEASDIPAEVTALYTETLRVARKQEAAYLNLRDAYRAFGLASDEIDGKVWSIGRELGYL